MPYASILRTGLVAGQIFYFKDLKEVATHWALGGARGVKPFVQAYRVELVATHAANHTRQRIGDAVNDGVADRALLDAFESFVDVLPPD